MCCLVARLPPSCMITFMGTKSLLFTLFQPSKAGCAPSAFLQSSPKIPCLYIFSRTECCKIKAMASLTAQGAGPAGGCADAAPRVHLQVPHRPEPVCGIRGRHAVCQAHHAHRHCRRRHQILRRPLLRAGERRALFKKTAKCQKAYLSWICKVLLLLFGLKWHCWKMGIILLVSAVVCQER